MDENKRAEFEAKLDALVEARQSFATFANERLAFFNGGIAALRDVLGLPPEGGQNAPPPPADDLKNERAEG